MDTATLFKKEIKTLMKKDTICPGAIGFAAWLHDFVEALKGNNIRSTGRQKAGNLIYLQLKM
jgi:hypothetical protein